MKNYKVSQGVQGAVKVHEAEDSFRIELKPSFLVDRLCEQLVFERNSIRLYTALMRKPAPKHSYSLNNFELEKLRDEKLDHFLLLSNALKEMGEDPSCGHFADETTILAPRTHLKVLSDRKTPVAQSLSVLLEAEQANWDGWQILISLAKNSGYEEMSKRFEDALMLEEEHLRKVRFWISQVMVFAEAKAA